MTTKLLSLLILSLLLAATPSHAQLDLQKEVLIIPDTHNEKPYIWKVLRNPKDYEFNLQYDAAAPGTETVFSMDIRSKAQSKIDDLHVFIADKDLHIYRHMRPVMSGTGKYTFGFKAPQAGRYRFEVVFKAQDGWINLSRDIKIKGDKKTSEPETKAGDEDYSVRVKLIPKKIYSEHVVTILYEIMYKGIPLKGLEKIDGFDMQVAAWDEDMEEFIYATPKQNLGGPEVAVSIVFMRHGRHAVFGEFKHKGIIRKIDLVVNVYEEPKKNKDSSADIKPSY
ncbi:MAG TPA: hypothetical protein DHV16_12135 [Nitrospiraceae bacterium]|nr:MAG: hypothetical protein A2Z82_00245 [Nitrospirae bacterium GWA2_46_11]HCZ12956.1 hypothetical protein [Nitrospiraceae bacterium]